MAPRDEEAVDKIFAGSMENLPPLSSKVVRIFTSSTFTDMLMERNTLMEWVYPKIKEYCKEKHGLEFQVVDMRWGVRDEMTNEHMTTALCMNELKGCQQYSMGPNFIYFGAQKYGYRPIPSEIDTEELTKLIDVLETMGNDTSLLKKWYRRDNNKVPPESILLPITTHLPHFLNKRMPRLQARDSGIWWGTLGKLQLMLRKASQALFANDQFTLSQMHNYRMAVTEREVINGCISRADNYVKDHVIIYTRILQNINLQNLKRASAFIDIADRHIDKEAQTLLTEYRDNKARNKMLDNKGIYKRYEIEWIGREGLSPDTHEEYLNDFINHFCKNTLKLVDKAMKKEDTSEQGRIVTELMQHLHGCKNNCDVFFGRTDELKQAEAYIRGPSNKPFVLYGAGGSGKSSMLSMTALKSVKEWTPDGNPILFVRFCGTTPNSASLGPLLKSICQQISYTFLLPFDDIPDDTVPVTAFLKELLNLATKERPLLIFFDSIDELTGSQDSNKMSWLPLKLPPHCKLVVSITCEQGKPDTLETLESLKTMIDDDSLFLEVTALGKELGWTVMKLWMKSAGRALNNYQWRVVANAFDHCTLPIFCKLVFQEVCRWKSYFEPELTVIRHTVMDSVFQLFERVENKHGWMLVSHALAYISAGKNGVSEPEIEDFISLDDKVLDDIYQYHLPPTRRIPPLLWTRVRSDLPGYLADSEADGVCVINWYHKQFKMAATARYFVTKEEYLYFHSYMADYFLGTYGGGVCKPFRYTEVQKHMFRLKSKSSTADRGVPAQPLAFYNKQGKLTRYNLRKFSELPFQLVRCYRYKDLFDNVLFNYKWLYAKMCALPLNEVLSDFEDAVNNIEDPQAKKEINLVADSIRLGGAILKHYPEMLASQLNGRLLPERQTSRNIQNLLRQCDEEGINQNALVPTFHCMHTPGGPLKYSMEGHQFGIFCIKLTSDNRYIVSVSNKFITFDVVTSDLARSVYPAMEGLMVGLELSEDNKFAAAYTNNNQFVILNTLVSEFVIIDNPFKEQEVPSGNVEVKEKQGHGEKVKGKKMWKKSKKNLKEKKAEKEKPEEVEEVEDPTIAIQGMVLLEGSLVVYSPKEWRVYNMTGALKDQGVNPAPNFILRMKMLSLTNFSLVTWSGNEDDPTMGLQSWEEEGVWTDLVEAHSDITLNGSQTKAFLCSEPGNNTVSKWEKVDGAWEQVRTYAENKVGILMLTLSVLENWVIATVTHGFNLWEVDGDRKHSLALPNGVRNVCKRKGVSSDLVLSARDKYAVAGIRKELYIWDLETEQLSKVLYAHFQRIVDIKSLVVGKENSVITSSVDRSIKVWDLNYIFEEDHHIDKHELTIESLHISTKAQMAVTTTRGCVGVWDYMHGKLKYTLAKNEMGAIVTHALVNEEGTLIVAAESGQIIIWDLATKKVIYSDECSHIVQMAFNKQQTKLLVVRGTGPPGSHTGHVEVRHFPAGEKQFGFEFTYRKFVNVHWTADEMQIVCYGFEKMKNHLYIHSNKSGKRLAAILVKYDGFKDVSNMVVLPDKGGIIALIDTEKGNIMDIQNKKFVKSIQGWGGNFTKDGKYGLCAPPSGGMDILDLRSGAVVRTLIPKISEGIFDVIAIFNQTNEYVLYYHSGRKTIRVFRRKDGLQIANYRVQADLKGMETTGDGKGVVLGMGDGSMTSLTIADPARSGTKEYLAKLPSRRNTLPEQTRFWQNGYPYPNPYNHEIYTDYLKELRKVIPGYQPPQ